MTRRLVAPDGTRRVGVRAAARLLEVHENTVRNWITSGELHAERLPVSGYARIPLTEIARLLEIGPPHR